MKKILLLVLSVMGAAGLTRVQAQILNVNFTDDSISVQYGGTPVLPAPSAASGAAVIGSAGDIWNGLGGFTYSPYPNNATYTSGPLVYADGTTSAITLSLSAPSGTYDANSSGFNNHSPFSWASLADEKADTGYPFTQYAALMASCLVANTTSATGFVVLSNLTPNGIYNLYTYNASDQNETTGRKSTFTVNGVTQTSTYDGTTTNLIDGVDYLEFAGFAASATGTLTIDFGDSLNAESDFNGLQLEPVGANVNTNLLVPVNVIATLGYAASSNDILVSFYQNDATATGYNLWRSTNAGGPYTEIVSNAPGTLTAYYTGTNDVSFVDTNAEVGVMAYYYEVQAVNASGPSALTSAAEVLFGRGNQLINPGFEDPQIQQGAGAIGAGILVGWDNVIGDSDDAYGYLQSGPPSGDTYCNGCNGTTTCAHDATPEAVLIHTGTNVGKLWTVIGAAPYTPNGLGLFHQTVNSPGGTWAGGGWVYESHEDLLAGVSFDFEVDFLDSGGNVLAAYQSYVVTNLTCNEVTPFPVDTWVYLNVTNVMQVTNGTNTGIVVTNTGPLGILTAPHNVAAVTFQATAAGPGSGSSFFDDVVLDQITAPILTLPTITNVTGNILFTTNTAFSCTFNSSDSVITNVQAIVTTSPLGGTATTVTNTAGAGLNVSGLNTASANVSLPLTSNLLYQVTIIGTDGNNLSVQTKAGFDTLSPTLVIEAADFNFSSGSFLDTPADGGLGLYVNDVGNQGVDEAWTRNTASPANDSYRSNDVVTIVPAAANNGLEQKFANVAAAVASGANPDTWDVPQAIGYAAVGDWLNYTRSYGSAGSNSAPAGLYNVYADMAINGTGTVGLYQVTSDITSGNQSSNFLGDFTLTDNNFNTYDYTPLRDPYGNLASVNLSGTATLKALITANTPNVAFYFLVPSAGSGPSVTSVYPTGLQPYGPTNAFTFTLSPGLTSSGASTVSSNGVSVILNGVNVTSSLTFSGSATNLTGSLPIKQQNIYTAVITATNGAGLVSVSTVTFNNFDPSDYSLDFSDYDFSTNNGSGWVSGLFIDDNVPTADSYGAALAPPNFAGTLASNSYFEYPKGFTPTVDPTGNGAIALQGIDIHFPENGQTGANNIYYRIDKNTSVSNNNDVGMFPSKDTTDGFRTKYLNAQALFNDPNIGSFQVGYIGGGNWLNYTRTFPSGNFYLWGRFAGAGGAISNTLSQVTAGVGTTNQTVALLGSFSGPQTGNYEIFSWYPLRDANGNMVNVALGGKETLRLTQAGNPENAIFVMLVPAPVELTLSASMVVAGQIHISFPTQNGITYTVYETSSLSNPNWTPVGSTIPGTGSVTSVNEVLSGTQGYYKVIGVP